MNKNTNYKLIRGMRDVFGTEAECFDRLLKAIQIHLSSNGYSRIYTPILEETELFSRSIGQGTDVVEKEMYTFDDHGYSLTMRPEATAGVVRAVIENGMCFGNHKLWTDGPVFRRERPQKGRYRQFYQASAESFGTSSPEEDVEQIILINNIWDAIGIKDNVKLHINTLATPETRKYYREILINYFNNNFSDLDLDSKRRLSKNPMRILDSKNPSMQKIIDNAPKLKDYLDDVSKEHFEKVLECLDLFGIDYVIDSKLVRGLDYYNHTVYEWITDKLGSQGSICGGGRYDGLAEHLGGKKTPAVGFAIGIDRTVLLMQEIGFICDNKPLVYFVSMGVKSKNKVLFLANNLRKAYPNQIIITNLNDSTLKNQLKKANQSGAKYAVIIGEDELEKEVASIKCLADGNQYSIDFVKFINFFNQ